MTARPSTLAAGVRQAQTAAPSTSTVQAPQSPASQPTLVPTCPSRSRSRLGQPFGGRSLYRNLGAIQPETGSFQRLRHRAPDQLHRRVAP